MQLNRPMLIPMSQLQTPLPSTFDGVSPRYVQVESSKPKIQGLKEAWLADESKAAH